MRRAVRIAIVGVVAAVTSMAASSPGGISGQVAEWSPDPTPTVSAGDGVGEGHDLGEGVYQNDVVMTMLRGADVVGLVRRSRGAVFAVRDGNLG